MRPRFVQLTASAALIAGLSFASVPAFSQDSGDFEKGVAAFEIGKYKEAIALWEPAAEEGNVDALRNMAQLYRLGLGVDQDDEKAFELYEKAAKAGSDDAQVNVAFQLLTGKGVDQDREKAASWFAKAADQGNALAQYNLGLMYEKGIGVERDTDFAQELYGVAADQGQRRALARLEALEKADETAAADSAEAEAAARDAAEIEARARDKAEEKRLAEAAVEKKKADREAKRPLLSIKPVDPKPAETEMQADAKDKDDRPVVNVVRTPMRKPGDRVADAPKGDEPTPIYIKRVNSDLDKAERSNSSTNLTDSKSAASASTGQSRMPSDPAARVKFAESAYRGGDFETAAKTLGPLSEAGMPIAQFWMGRLYNRGEGVGLNRAEAYSLWRSAAAGGSERAATALANLASRLSAEEISVAEQRYVLSGRAR